MLIERGADPSAQDKGGSTPLHDGSTPLRGASQEGHAEATRMLIEGGADPSSSDNPAAVCVEYMDVELAPPHNEQGWFTLSCFINRYILMIGVLLIAVSYFIR